MVAQRRPGAAPVVRGTAEALPFGDHVFDAATALLTVHHWADFGRGLAEMRRVARRRVIVLTWDREVVADAFWLARDYFPDVREAERWLATLDEIVAVLGTSTVETVPVRMCSICQGCPTCCGARWGRVAPGRASVRCPSHERRGREQDHGTGAGRRFAFLPSTRIRCPPPTP